MKKDNNIIIIFSLLNLLLLCMGIFFTQNIPEPDKTTSAIEVADMAGRPVKLDGPARKVMMLTPTLWHYLAVEESGEHLLMLAPYMKKEVDDSILGRVFPELSTKRIMTVDRKGSAPFSVEETLRESPDLVFVWEYLSPGYEKLGIKGLLKIRNDGGDKRQLYQILAGVTGHKERVEWLWSRHAREMGLLEADALKKPDTPQTLVVIANDSFSLWSGSGYKRFNDNLALIHAVNLAGETGRPVLGPLNIETLLSLDPDVIFLTFSNLVQNTLTVDSIMSDPRFAGLKSVANRRIYHMPMGAMRLEGPVEEPLFLIWLGQTLHPGLGSGLSLRKRIREAYLEVFDYRMTEDEIDAWLRYAENRLSAGHEIFQRSH
jgi:iron complex transport system substrate-binding protein